MEFSGDIEWWGIVLILVGLLIVLVGVGWLSDWTLRKRVREALEQRGRDENAAQLRLERMGGRPRREGWVPPGWFEELEQLQAEGKLLDREVHADVGVGVDVDNDDDCGCGDDD